MVLGEAAAGLEAPELARQVRPDVVLMEVTMKIGGVESARRIKAELTEVRVKERITLMTG